MSKSDYRESIVNDGEPDLGRDATLFHAEFGALTRVTNEPVRVGSVRFRADQIRTPRILVEYTAEELADAWESTLFEDPIHAEDVLGDGEGETEGDDA